MRPEVIGRTRPVLVLTAVSLTMIGHGIRTQPTVLRGYALLWWGVFAVASWVAVVAAVTLSRGWIATTGALVVTAFVSRAVAVIVGAATHHVRSGSVLLAVTLWLLVAYYWGIVFWHLVRDTPELAPARRS